VIGRRSGPGPEDLGAPVSEVRVRPFGGTVERQLSHLPPSSTLPVDHRVHRVADRWLTRRVSASLHRSVLRLTVARCHREAALSSGSGLVRPITPRSSEVHVGSGDRFSGIGSEPLPSAHREETGPTTRAGRRAR
jgi:hypothetical protein